jgi:hypothetical protein
MTRGMESLEIRIGRRAMKDVNIGRRVVIACRVMEPELERVRAETEEEVEIVYLDQALHRTPTRLLGQLQEKIDQVAQRASRIILGYGLCSNGVVGVTARQQGLIIPAATTVSLCFWGRPPATRKYSVRSRGPTT